MDQSIQSDLISCYASSLSAFCPLHGRTNLIAPVVLSKKTANATKGK